MPQSNENENWEETVCMRERVEERVCMRVEERVLDESSGKRICMRVEERQFAWELRRESLHESWGEFAWDLRRDSLYEGWEELRVYMKENLHQSRMLTCRDKSEREVNI